MSLFLSRSAALARIDLARSENSLLAARNHLVLAEVNCLCMLSLSLFLCTVSVCTVKENYKRRDNVESFWTFNLFNFNGKRQFNEGQ